MLQLKIREKEEELKASKELVNVYKDQNQQLLSQRQVARSEFQTMNTNLIKTNNKATAFRVACIALAVILVLFVGLVVT